MTGSPLAFEIGFIVLSGIDFYCVAKFSSYIFKIVSKIYKLMKILLSNDVACKCNVDVTIDRIENEYVFLLLQG